MEQAVAVPLAAVAGMQAGAGRRRKGLRLEGREMRGRGEVGGCKAGPSSEGQRARLPWAGSRWVAVPWALLMAVPKAPRRPRRGSYSREERSRLLANSSESAGGSWDVQKLPEGSKYLPGIGFQLNITDTEATAVPRRGLAGNSDLAAGPFGELLAQVRVCSLA